MDWDQRNCTGKEKTGLIKSEKQSIVVRCAAKTRASLDMLGLYRRSFRAESAAFLHESWIVSRTKTA